ncbi:MAG TPA: NADH-quinone oxidoreductase subunit NuoE [Desulfobacteraceae bacterium]|nr:NADH-quinone oxidoreductase subunit NuoE [Deltaproteobacteria bacterium]RLB96307.1 MAG: NADH-quinone oxidoreductase subunit NuoE [Deltaproteobacteria bacterium]HDI59391.1 NADH-quinone oxidoreductase subunit NuoE [Desulfobacteraceae bacterium]HDI59400.1 NADH-quinone oxidoreductase subunit NuoE [Desulfobacteraceae bacterium]
MNPAESDTEAQLLKSLPEHLAPFGTERSNLIPILQMVQKHFSYLPAAAMEIVARHLDIPLAEVYGVATFYNQFRFTPPGRHPIKVCLGTACHVKGGDIILENFERKLGIRDGETTADREFSIERVACVGCCALAPVALVGETVHGNMAPSKIEGLFTRIQVEKEMAQRKKRENEPDA